MATKNGKMDLGAIMLAIVKECAASMASVGANPAGQPHWGTLADGLLHSAGVNVDWQRGEARQYTTRQGDARTFRPYVLDAAQTQAVVRVLLATAGDKVTRPDAGPYAVMTATEGALAKAHITLAQARGIIATLAAAPDVSLRSATTRATVRKAAGEYVASLAGPASPAERAHVQVAGGLHTGIAANDPSRLAGPVRITRRVR